MRAKLLALSAGLLLLVLALGAGTAVAGLPDVQTVGQTASNDQTADATSGAAQVQPSNTNISVRVLSPGDDGDVTQTNSVSSDAAAGNANDTSQSAGQLLGGGTQTVGQAAGSTQAADALSGALQLGGLNANAPVDNLAPSGDGSVQQAGSADASAAAGNAASTDQSAEQRAAAPCGCDGSGTQTVGQAASNEQEAGAASLAKQVEPRNTNVAVRVLSPGNDGDVTQTNAVDSSAKAGNRADLDQSAMQAQGGSSGSQSVGQAAKNEQAAGALSAGVQEGAKNVNVPVRVLSPGNGGDVTQTNSVSSHATAGNANDTSQAAKQVDGAGRYCSCFVGTQAVGQAAKNEQAALAGSLAVQKDAKNVNVPVRVLSPGSDGDVSQSNSVDSQAKAGNANELDQAATQAAGGGLCGCGAGKGVQVVGQAASSEQAALAGSAAIQKGAENLNAPVRVLSPGSDGDVSQSNRVDSEAKAGNRNDTDQSAAQGQAGGLGGLGVQAIGQYADSKQLAGAASFAAQLGAKNANVPVRVLSPGAGGSVEQENAVSSSAAAGNANDTDQKARQVEEGGRCGCIGGIGIQAIGQAAKSEQGALAASLALQKGAENVDAPVRVLSPGWDGHVSQSNTVSSEAKAGNRNDTEQSAGQSQGGFGGLGIQAVGQAVHSTQLAGALSLAAQLWAKNVHDPVAVLSPSHGHGSVTQSNDTASRAGAGNATRTQQSSWTSSFDRCGCDGKHMRHPGNQLDDEWTTTPDARALPGPWGGTTARQEGLAA